jgi:trimethylamine--corrinoid protein Co-methyltransferase
VDKVGPGGHYLLEEHTLKHFRNVWYSDLFDRSIYDQWLAKGGKQFEERLRQQTQQAMEHQPAPLPGDVVRELARMEKHWE